MRSIRGFDVALDCVSLLHEQFNTEKNQRKTKKKFCLRINRIFFSHCHMKLIQKILKQGMQIHFVCSVLSA